jgi:hypothetical protein
MKDQLLRAIQEAHKCISGYYEILRRIDSNAQGADSAIEDIRQGILKATETSKRASERFAALSN